jgi:hypothetical protein
MHDAINAQDSTDASVISGGVVHELAGVLKGTYHARCFGPDGQLKWEDTIHNLITTPGGNKLLDVILGNVAAGAVFMGLKGTGAAVIADTQGSHASWLEVGLANAPAYTGNRQTPTFSAAAAKSKATSAVVSYTFTSAGTVAGCFINLGGSATKDDVTGTLFSAGDFAASKTVGIGDRIEVSYSLAV